MSKQRVLSFDGGCTFAYSDIEIPPGVRIDIYMDGRVCVDDVEDDQLRGLLAPYDGFATGKPLEQSPWIFSVNHNEQNEMPPGFTMQNNTCAICMDKEVQTYFYPCQHEIVCYSCYAMIEKPRDTRCPLCRRGIIYCIQVLQ